jgi:hypothetical protein
MDRMRTPILAVEVTQRAAQPAHAADESEQPRPLGRISMKHPKRCAVALLLGGLLLAVGTPAYIAYAAPNLAGYLLRPTLFLGQLAPYVLCAGLWLPWRASGAATTAVILSGLLLLAGVILYVPMLWAPASHGGDMIGLAFVAISVGTTTALALASAVALLVLWLRRRDNG